jgi:hypothetical protein
MEGDLDSIYRRLSVIAYEDIGLANPAIGPRLDAAINACERVGLPEGRIPLGTIVTEMALSPKSNTAHIAFDMALEDIEKGNVGMIPNHIRPDSPDYKYPHDYPGVYVVQQYLPDKLKNKKYYKPKDIGYIYVNMPVNIQIESFNYNEWGTISGKVKEIEAKILNNFSSEKTQFIFDLLFAHITTPYITNPTLTNINFQYECLSLLINLIIDTNKYNDIFYANLHQVYNHILTISTQPHLIINNKQLQTIYYHFIWLLGNIIQGYNHPFPNNINIPQLISNIQIHYINEYQVLSYNIWLLSIYLDQVNIDTYFQFTCFIDSLLTLIEQKHKEISIIIITNILQVISLLIKNELCFNYILDKYNFIITFLINSYHLYTTAQKTLINFIKYDKQSIIPQKFDIYKQIIFDILFTQTKQYENELIINTLKLFRYLIVITSSMEHNCLITKFINDKKTFSYFQMNYMYLSIDEHERKLLKNVYKILYELFDKGNIYIKEYLCENNLHMYMINEIKKIDNNNGHNNKLIVIILKCLASMLYFEKQSKNKIIIGATASKSAILNNGKGEHHTIYGIGSNIIPAVLDKSVVDMILPVTEEEAYQGVKELYQKYGLKLGVSTGATYVIAKKASLVYPKKRIVFISADGADRYTSLNLYN